MDDINDDDVCQLTRLLRAPNYAHSVRLPEIWYSRQASEVHRLNPSLRRPSTLLVRAAVRLGLRGVPHFPNCANLCRFHQALDPRIIRDLLMMIMDECTVRSDRFRNFPDHTEDAVKAWSHRLDEVVGMWLGRDLLVQIFGQHLSLPPSNTPIYDRCEACMIAIVGGRVSVLADLHSSLVARYTFRQQTTRRRNPNICQPPRLLRVVRSWLSHLDVSTNNELVYNSDVLVQKLLHSRRIIDAVERDAPTPSSAASGRSHSHRGQSRYVRLIHYGVLVPRVINGKKTSRRMQHHRRSGNPLRKLAGKLVSIKARLSGLRTVRHHARVINSNTQARGDRTGDSAVDANGASRHNSNDTPRSRDNNNSSSSGIITNSSFRGFDNASAVPRPLNLEQTRQAARERASLDNPSSAVFVSGALRDDNDLNDASRLSRNNTVSAQRDLASLPSHPGGADSTSAQRPPRRRRTDSVSAVCNFDISTPDLDRADSTSAQRGLASLPSHHSRTASASAQTHNSSSQYIPARRAWPANHPKAITRKPVAPPASSVYSTDPSPSHIYSTAAAPSRVSTALASSNALPTHPARPPPSSVYSTDPTPSRGYTSSSSRLPRRSMTPATPLTQATLPLTPPSSGRSHNPRQPSASASRPRPSNMDRRPQTPHHSAGVRTVRRSTCGPGNSPSSWM